MSFVHCQSCHRAYDLRRQPSCPACQRAEQAKQEAKPPTAVELSAVELSAVELSAVELSAAAAPVSEVVIAAADADAEAARGVREVSSPSEVARDLRWLAEANELAETLAGATPNAAGARAGQGSAQAAAVPSAEPAGQIAEEIEVVLEAELVVDAEPAPGPSSAALSVEPPRAHSTPATAERIVSMVEELAAMLERASTSELEAARHQLQERGLKAPWSIKQLPAASGRLLAAGERLVTEAIRQPRKTVRRLASRLRDAWAGSSARM